MTIANNPEGIFPPEVNTEMFFVLVCSQKEIEITPPNWGGGRGCGGESAWSNPGARPRWLSRKW